LPIWLNKNFVVKYDHSKQMINNQNKKQQLFLWSVNLE